MSDPDDRTRARTHTAEDVPLDKRPGHERGSDDDPVVETVFEDADGDEWFTVGNANGVVCTRDPVDIER